MRTPLWSDAQKRALREMSCRDCEAACMLLPAERYRKRLTCCYRHESVKPIPKAAADRLREIAGDQVPTSTRKDER